ncbi:MAG TPA: methylated-DNA--[protein]-cysteine S-methyltransferase, partial [Candidatus Cloacimonadota bacterium]|nr:methylated-DNA--[protein]-cysteine S-methyltransferase [Candidatus Cloacimonadota bacterium]
QVLEQDKPLINQIKEFLNNYFLSKNPQEDFALQDNNGEFYLQVMSEIRQIPYGKTLIYSDLAKKINRPKAARAVGNALGKNSILIINPCHRVVAKTGLGGFTANLWRKKYLLALEQGKLIDIGLNSTQVRLSSNSTHWNELFNIEKEAILSVLDIDPIQIQHIGSTAINNIQAKPIIDIMLGVKPEQVTEIMPLLKLIGWVYKANFEPKEWHFLAKEINGYVTHHLHVCHYNSNFYKEH